MSELERSLLLLGRELDVPEPPDLAPAILARIEPQRQQPRRHRRLVLAFAVVLAAALVATLAIPDARSALARLFSIGAERIEVVDELPTVTPPTAELELTLGQRATLEEARDLAMGELLELDDAPDAVYIGTAGTVWFLYGRPDAPRLLVAQTPSVSVDEPALFKKLAAAGTSIRALDVRGERGYLLSGDPHLVFLIDENGQLIGDSARLARDVLVWVEGGSTIRLEGEFSEQEATRIAESLGVRSGG